MAGENVPVGGPFDNIEKAKRGRFGGSRTKRDCALLTVSLD